MTGRKMAKESAKRKPRRVILIGDGGKKAVRDAVGRVRGWLEKSADLIATDLGNELDLSKIRADLLLVFGGDGFILQSARRLAGNQIPVFGVNFGKFGFLAETMEDEFKTDIARVLSGDVVPSKRMMLAVTARRGKRVIGKYLGLNDAVINRPSISRMIYISLIVNGERVTTYACDGLIASSPVGSTAHSLSAGGPILVPGMEAFVVTPICPHTLSNRPLVFPGESLLRLELDASFEPSMLTVDGQVSREIVKGDSVEIRKCSRPFLLVETGKRTYFEILRTKMGWGGHMLPRP